MSQLVLGLAQAPQPAFRNFVPGRNGECVQTLLALIDGARVGCVPQSRICYVWGPTGTGKSHLAGALRESLASIAGRKVDVVDDVQKLSIDAQVALMNRFHELQQDPQRAIVAFGALPPAQLAVIPELSSRLAWGLVFALAPLDDRDRRRALLRMLDERGIEPDDALIDHLLRRTRRDIGSLKQTIDRLDAYSLQCKRPVGLSLLKRLEQQSGAGPNSDAVSDSA